METYELYVSKHMDGLDHSAHINLKVDLVSELLGEGGRKLDVIGCPCPSTTEMRFPKSPRLFSNSKKVIG